MSETIERIEFFDNSTGGALLIDEAVLKIRRAITANGVEQFELVHTELNAALSLLTQAKSKGQELAKYQPCGCVLCSCEDEEQCHGCGAKNCGNHPPGELPNPVYKYDKVNATIQQQAAEIVFLKDKRDQLFKKANEYLDLSHKYERELSALKAENEKLSMQLDCPRCLGSGVEPNPTPDFEGDTGKEAVTQSVFFCSACKGKGTMTAYLWGLIEMTGELLRKVL